MNPVVARRRFVAAAVAVLLAGMYFAAPAAATTTGITWCDSNHASLDILGDSGSTGYGSTGYSSSTDTYAATTYGWVPRVTALLGHTVVRDYAHNGALASDFLPGGRWSDTVAAVGKVAVDQPAAVLIELGGNEYSIDEAPSTFASQLQQLISNVHAASPSSTILLVWIWQIGVRSAPSPVHPWSEYGSVIRNTAIANSAAYIDLTQYMPSATTDLTGPITGLYTSDHIHPDDAGNLTEAAIYYDFLIRC